MNVGTLIYGAGSSKTAGSEAKRLAVSEEPVLLVTDKGVTKAGIPSKIREIVENEGLRVEVYDELAAEPTWKAQES